MLESLFWLLIPLLWVALVGFGSGWAGYYLGFRIICRSLSYRVSKNATRLLAIALVVAAWYATGLWIAANSSFDGALIPSLILTFICAPIAVLVALLVASIAVQRYVES